MMRGQSLYPDADPLGSVVLLYGLRWDGEPAATGPLVLGVDVRHPYERDRNPNPRPKPGPYGPKSYDPKRWATHDEQGDPRPSDGLLDRLIP